jgi:PAS domain S-box-containing protein
MAFAEHVSTIIDLERSKELLDKFRLLLETTKDIVLLIEPEGKVVEANQAALKAYGYSREELLSLKIIDLRADLGRKDKQQMRVVKEKGIVF